MNIKEYQDQAVVSTNLRQMFKQVIYRQEMDTKYESFNIMRSFYESKTQGTARSGDQS